MFSIQQSHKALAQECFSPYRLNWAYQGSCVHTPVEALAIKITFDCLGGNLSQVDKMELPKRSCEAGLVGPGARLANLSNLAFFFSFGGRGGANQWSKYSS